MRELAATVLFCVLVSTACLAQGTDGTPKLFCLARVLDTMVDIELLGKLAPLRLTEQQFQALAEVYKQYPLETFSLASAETAADKLSDIRAGLVAGKTIVLSAAEQQAMGKMLEVAFRDMAHAPPPRPEQPVTELTPQESLIWAILTESQRGSLLGAGTDDQSNQAGAKRALEVIGQLRGKDQQTWVASRDRLAECLSAASGAAGTPARENRRQVFLDFLNRVRAMTEADFAAKRDELIVEFVALLPENSHLALAIADFDPGQIHNALVSSLLTARAPALLQEMQTAQAKKAAD